MVIMVMDDLIGFGVLSVFFKKGFVVLKDVFIVSFNNVLLLEIVSFLFLIVDVNIY